LTGGEEVGGSGPASERMEITVISVGLGAPRRPAEIEMPAPVGGGGALAGA
jgi:hypothetical protein